MAALTGKTVVWPSHSKRLAVCIAFSTAAHVAALLLPLRTPRIVAYPPARPVVVTLPAKDISQTQPTLPLLGYAATSDFEANRVQREAIELAPLASEFNKGEAATVYLPANELTRKPRPLADWDALGWKLPPQAQGVVNVTIYVSATGEVDKLEFANSVSSEIQEWVRDVLIAGTRFSPGERNGLPVPSRTTIELELAPIRR